MIPLLLASLLAACPTKDPNPDTSSGTCDPGPSGTALLQPSCAPDDGTAVDLFVHTSGASCSAAPETPWVRISLWMGREDLCACRLDIALEGAATLDPGDGEDLRNAAGGEVFFEIWDGTTTSGSYTLTFDDGTCIEGTFEGPWCDADVICG